MALVDLLKAVGLFHGLTDDQLQRLIAISQEEVYDEGQIIFRQNAEGDKLYFIGEGQVEIRIRKRPEAPERSQVFLGAARSSARWPCWTWANARPLSNAAAITPSFTPSAAKLSLRCAIRIRRSATSSCETWRWISRSSSVTAIWIWALIASSSPEL